jgi:hypothetical protein
VARGSDRRFLGTIDIASTPPGAEVTIDSRPAGTTPLVLEEFPAGTHVVRIDLAGHQRWSRAVLVSTGQRAKVNASLRPMPHAAVPR